MSISKTGLDEAMNQLKEFKFYGKIGTHKDGLAPKSIYEALEASDNLRFRLHSPGGSVFDGLDMYTSARAKVEEGTNLEICIDGLAASMTFVFMLAADRRVAAKNAMFMIHGPSGRPTGTIAQVESGLESMRIARAQMKQIIVDRTGQSEEVVEGWLSRDTWFSAEQALQLGIIHEIKDSIFKREKVADSSTVSSVSSVFEAFTLTESKPDTTHKKIISMDGIFQALDLEANAPEEEVLAAINHLRASVTAAATDLAAKIKENQALQASLDKFKVEAAKQRAASLVDSKIDLNVIPKAQRETWLSLAATNFDSAKAALDAMSPIASLADSISSPDSVDLFDGLSLQALAEKHDQYWRSGELARFPESARKKLTDAKAAFSH